MPTVKFKSIIVEKIFNIVFEKIVKEKESIRESINRCKNEIKEAPGPMVSHSDTTRYQVSQQVFNLSDHLAKLEHAEKIIHEASINNVGSTISVGSIVELEIDGGNMFAFIVPNGLGGLKVDSDIKISIVSEKSPMAVSIIGKKIGDLVFFKTNGNEKKIKIINF